MRKIPFFLLLLLATPVAFLFGQQNPELENRFRTHISYLADDKLEGRESGTKGGILAGEYIEAEFNKIKLKAPEGKSGFQQGFDFLNGKNYGPGCELKVDGKALKIGEDWYPLPYSISGSVQGNIVNVGYGISAPDLGHDDYASLPANNSGIFLMELTSPDGIHPHSKYKNYSDIRTKLETAEKKGAKAVIFLNNDPNLDNPEEGFSRKIAESGVMVVFLTEGKAEELAGKNAVVGVDLQRDDRKGFNVVGKLDNGAKQTLVIGGHFDHLGYGSEGSLHRGEAAIHNGADDNASGTAMFLELARTLQANGPKNLNYVFIGFDGEEKGLLGSNYYVNNPAYPLENVLAMINFDMVGRVPVDAPGISITGVGTSPFWGETLPEIKSGDLKVTTSESGIGPSDHTSFYLKNIPVLHFFSGTHSDYHKPSDDEPLINYEGMVRVHDFVVELIEQLADKGEIEFTKTKDADSRKAPKFSVTLGVVPNYLYDGEGMKIDGVSEGKPAEAAGIQAGDIIIRMGDVPIVDMMSYMKALGQFKKGDKIKVKILRDGKEKTKKVQF